MNFFQFLFCDHPEDIAPESVHKSSLVIHAGPLTSEVGYEKAALPQLSTMRAIPAADQLVVYELQLVNANPTRRHFARSR
jgi:hypothetical protein